MSSNPTHKIVNGPSKWDLMLGLFDNTASSRRFVTFEVTTPDGSSQIKVGIDSVQREDGSGESWNYEGHNKDGDNIGGYYRTDTRKGNISRM